jgi:hypothetical protein
MKHLKHLKHTCNMRFQQNLAAGRAEHCTAESSCAVLEKNEDDSGLRGPRRAVALPPAIGRAVPAM